MILVVGGAGYIGSHVVKQLREAQLPHLVFDNLSSGHRASVGDSPFVIGDLRSRSDLDEVFDTHPIDVVMHFAAHISVGESVREPAKYFENNTVGVLTLLESMRAYKVKQFVFSSTAAVFGEPEHLPIEEEHPKHPTSPYGTSKLMVEQMLSAFDHAYGLRSVVLRYFNAAGAAIDGSIGEDHHPEEHLIPLAIAAATGRRGELRVFGTDYPTPDGTCVRDFVHVEDLADAHLRAAAYLRNGGSSREFNLGNGHGFSVRQVIDTVSKIVGRPVPYVEAERRAGDPAQLIASAARAKTELGWSPKYAELEKIVSDAWRWHESHPQGFGDVADS